MHPATTAARTSPRRACATTYTGDLANCAQEYPSLPGARVEPVPLPRVERLGQPVRGRARERHPVRHQLLLLAGELDGRPPGLHDRIRHAAAVRASRRHDGRRVPGADPDDRRVRPELPVHPEHAARPCPRGARATTATSSPTCTPTSPTPAGHGAAVVRAARVACPSCRLATCSSSSTAATCRRSRTSLDGRNTLTFTVVVGAGATNLTAMVPTAGPGGLVLDGPRGRGDGRTSADDQGHRVRPVQRCAGTTPGDLLSPPLRRR